MADYDHLTSPEPSEAKAAFEELMQGPMSSQMPRVMRLTISKRPDIFASFSAAFDPIFFQGLIPATLKQMIIMAISIQRGCRFCSNVHTAMLESLSEGAGLPLLDLRPFYTGIDARRLAVVPFSDPHPNELAHRIAADAIADYLIDHSVLPIEENP